MGAKETPYYFGADLGYGLVSYDANFANFKGINKCGIYETGSGTGITGRLFTKYRLADFFNIGLHIGYNHKNAEMNKLDTAFARNFNTGKVEIVETNNQLNMNFNSILLGLDFNFLLVKDFFNGPLYLNISPNLNIQISGDYVQKEFLNSPNGVAFEENGKIFFERLNAQGDFTTLTSSVFNISAGLLNNMRIAHNLYFTQRLGVNKGLVSLLTDAEIKTLSLYASIGIKVAFDEPQVVLPTIPPKSPIQPEPMPLRPLQTITLKSEFDYNESYIEKGEKLVATTPIVLAVFFDLNSSKLKPEYGNSFAKTNDPISEHYHIFQNLKEILSKNPDAMLKLNGSTSGKDENNNLELAKARVETIKNEFLELGIPASKLITSYSVNPKVITNAEYEEGLEENRRVSIDLVNANSIKFVKKANFKKLYGQVNYNIVSQNIDTPINFGSSILEKNEEVNDSRFNKSFIKDVGESGNTLEIISFAGINSLIKDEDTVSVNLDKVEVRNVSLETNEFKAVLMFNFASSVLTNEAKTLLSQLSELLPDGTTIQMIGNSDSIGLEKANKQIAEERANNAIQYIKSNSKKTFFFEKLTDTNEFEESTPQGRYLNRSIIIRIK